MTTTATGSDTRRPDASPRAATATAVTAWGLGLLSLLLLLGARPALDENLWFYVVDLAVALVYGTVAAVVLWRRRHPVAWLLALTAVGGALAATGFAYGALATTVGGLPAEAALARLSSIAWLPGTFALFLVVPWLVREDEPELQGDRLLARIGLPLGAALTVTLSVLAFLPPNPTLVAVDQTLTAAAVVVGLVAAYACLLRGRAVPAGERSGYRWLALGTAIVAVSFVPIAVPLLFAYVPVATIPLLHLVSQAVYPAAVLVVVLRRRMWGLDLAVSRTVLAGALTLGLAAAYVAVTAVVTLLLPDAGLAQVAAAAVVVAAVQPSRLWLQRRVDRLVHGDASDPAQAVRRLGAHLGSAATTEDLLGGLVDSVAVALRVDAVTLVVDGRVLVSRGELDQHSVGVPLEHRGAPVGRLVVTPPGGERLDARSRAALEELAGVVAAGVALTLATQDLEAARERVTAARMTERRVIRRELHDGLGPSLAGLRLGLEGARNLVHADPDTAIEVLSALQAELDQRVQDVRSLSRDLLPPVLDELGLAAALDELAARHAVGGFDVRVDCVLPVPPAPGLAGAAYGILAEAVTNAARHSGAAGCDVRVHHDGESLVLSVTDDGAGFPVGTVPGVGTSSMRERAEEAGGSLRLHGQGPQGSGTVVEAVLPWRT